MRGEGLENSKCLICDIDKENLNTQSKYDKIIAFKSLNGYDYRSKIPLCAKSDIAINPIGTGSLLLVFICKVPFVGFDAPRILNFYYNFRKSKHRVAYEKFVCLNDDNSSIYFACYHIPPQHIYNLAAEVLEELSKEGKLKIKNLKMHRLFVPDVELVKRQV